MASENGVWRTISGRRVFIKDGQSLSEAMKESGKFKSAKKNNEENKNEEYEVSDLKKKAMAILPKEDIDTHEGDLYIKKTKESEELLKNLKNKDNGLLTTFKDQQTGETWYDVPFGNMEDNYLKNYDYEKEMPVGAKFSKMLEEGKKEKYISENYGTVDALYEMRTGKKANSVLDKALKENEEWNKIADEVYNDRDKTEMDLGKYDYANEKNHEKRLENVYKMDRVLRGMNNEDALDDGWLMNAVADEDTDGGFEEFKKNAEQWDFKNNKPTGDYDYTSDEDYNRMVKMYRNRVKEYAKDGVMTQDWYKGEKFFYSKENAGLTDEEIEFLKQDVEDFPIYDKGNKTINSKDFGKKDHTFDMTEEDKRKYEKVGKKIDNLTKEIEENKSDFYNNLSSKEKTQYDNYLKQGYSKNDIEGTLMYKSLDDRMRDSGMFYNNTDNKNELQNKANKVVKELNNNSNNKYEATKREGFGSYNKDNIPVYDNKIDYTGDFSNANLKTLSNEELTMALNKQNSLYKEALNEKLGDQRTRNGKMDKIFNTAKRQKYEDGTNKILKEMEERNMPRYNIYNEKNNMLMVSAPTKEIAEKQLEEMYEVDKNLQKTYNWKETPKYKMVEENSTINSINNSLQRKGYEKYLREHPKSKMTFEEYTKQK